MGKQCDVCIKIIKAGKKKGCVYFLWTWKISDKMFTIEAYLIFVVVVVTAQQNTAGDCKFSSLAWSIVWFCVWSEVAICNSWAE